ncbi:MAG: hypothetical protein B6229_08465 [Spirochaetaceae bacterium 4572_7]|nr:MAG: hypothetical protein B6229_08465 [Spirochaetaceae bacterium 4572_7]
MGLNSTEIDKILEELELQGSILQGIKAIDYNTFSFLFYKPGKPISVLVSVLNNYRIHKLNKKPDYLKESHSFVDYIKKQLVGSVVKGCNQVNNNRIIKIELEKDSSLLYNMYIRLWGGFSNIIVTDSNNYILHLHRKSSKKDELTGKTFIIPPKKNGNIYILREHNYPSYNDFIENNYFNEIKKSNDQEQRDKFELLRTRRIKELSKQLKSLNKRLFGYEKGDDFKLWGDLITSNLHLIKGGDTFLKVMDYTSGVYIAIPIDPRLKPYKNSELYYKKYKKSLNGLGITQEMIAKTTRELNSLKDDSADLSTLLKPVNSKSNNIEKEGVGLNYKSGNWEIMVGRNAKENDYLLRHSVKGNDMWFHSRDFPGGYVFIKNRKGVTIPLEILLDAGMLALFYSKGKNNLKGDVYYTQVKHLRRVKNGKLGLVIPTMDKNLYVTINKERLEKLKA